LLLTIAVPSLITEAGWSSLPFAAPTAAAQPADAATEVARQRYEDGVKFFDAGRYDDARGAFLQTYSLKRHPAVLLNLGLSEVKSGHPEDGGNHLQQFLREHTTATPDQRQAADKGIVEAKKKSAFVIVIVDANGADVSLDGANIGKAPLLDPYFVKAGKHTLLATYQGKNATTQVDAKIGSATAANLTLGTSGTAPAPAPVAPAPTIPTTPPSTAQPPPAVAPTVPTGPAAGTFPPPNQQPAVSGSFMGPGLPPDQGVSEREPFFDWYTRKPLAWVGTGVAGVGLVLGIAFSAAASGASSSADGHVNDIKEEARRQGFNGPPCGDADSGAGDDPHYHQACDVLRDDISAHDTDVAVATAGWVFFGVGVVGTAAYAMIDWFPKKKPSSGALDPRIVAIAPVVTQTQQGIGVVGSF
jgi:hypothetical protein